MYNSSIHEAPVMSSTVTATPQSLTKKFQFALIIPIFVNTSEWLIKILKENNCQDMIPSIQFKHLNLHVYREAVSFEDAVTSAKKDVANALEKFGFSDMKILVINYEK